MLKALFRLSTEFSLSFKKLQKDTSVNTCDKL